MIIITWIRDGISAYFEQRREENSKNTRNYGSV